ncbi:putative cytosol aminopeptidase [Sporomusaceae bacterium FL31]|nr:putative cytosol aminopeptidase [Sporomusaceae bacterium FL31]GCE33533.1 putative cytosol aminopeptidase [Sporomusaceae bacterium]
MNIEIRNNPITEIICDTLIISLFEEPNAITKTNDNHIDTLVREFLRDNPASGKYGEINMITILPFTSCKRILLLGLGKEADLTSDKIRHLSAIAIRSARKTHSKTVAAILYRTDTDKITPINIAKSMVEGTLLGNYQFLYYKTEQKDSKNIEKFTIINLNPSHQAQLEQAVVDATVIADSVNYARDLVNHPACYMTPSKLAASAIEMANQEKSIEVSVLNTQEMQQLGMGALLAVAQGSTEAPKLITLKYTGNKNSTDLIAYVGKGITFDSGGISLKPSNNMGEMKGDMAGAAAVLAAMQAIARLKPKTNLLAIIPCSENMPSGCALKPGDVIKSMSGYTIEIISTDAEGRLLLADAITYAKKLGATKIVDIATLTGACVVALGTITSGVITNNTAWCQQILSAAEQCGEKMWQLPAYDEYKEQIKSDIADLKNSGGRFAGAITAGLFIEKFTANTPWVHIDIAGTSDSASEKGYNVKGATGAPVRTLIQLAFNQDDL